ncbi:MAG: DUF4031 domain-containing protein [Pseudonocardiaceae bacterium]
MTIFVDDAQVPNRDTGRTVSSRWSHLISDQLDPEELHTFATQILGLRRSYFQPGHEIGSPGEPDPSGDHYDLTAGKRKQAIAKGARAVSSRELGDIIRRKRLTHCGIPDIRVIAQRLAREEGVFALSCHNGQWTVALEWGQEAPGSPMTGAAAYGTGTTAREAIDAAAREAGWE